MLGHGPLQRLLDDIDVTEIMVNGYDTVYVERAGRSRCRACGSHPRSTCARSSSGSSPRSGGGSMSRRRWWMPDWPMARGQCDHRAAGVQRIHADHPEVRQDPFKVNDLIRFGTLTDEMADAAQACVEAKLNIIVSGGTGSGKTTLLNVLSSFIPDGERIVTIEDASSCSSSRSTSCGWSRVRRTSRARARSTSATWSGTRSACA